MTYDLTRLHSDIAQVQHDGAGFGTGRLVAENLILTAAHTLWNLEKGIGPELNGWQIRLARDRVPGPWSFRCGNRVVWYDRGFDPRHDQGLDLALIELVDPVGGPLRPGLRLRVATVSGNNDHAVEARGYPRAAKHAEVPGRDLTRAGGRLWAAYPDRPLSFGVDHCALPNKPHDDWAGMSGSAVLLQDWPDQDEIWVYGVVGAVPGHFDGQLSVARLADAWQNATLRGLLVTAGALDKDAEDPTGRNQGQLDATVRARASLEGSQTLEESEFKPFLDERGTLFEGRKWVFDKIDAWCQSGDEKCMLIVGDAGIGKSAIVADLVRRNPGGRLLAYHCCRRDTQVTLEPTRFVRSLARMLADSLPAYKGRIAQPDIWRELSETSSRAPEQALEAGILAPLRGLNPPKGVNGATLFLIDGLDEAASFRHSGTEQTITQITASHLERFPSWLRLLATTTRLRAMSGLSNRAVLDLNAQSPENLQDVEAFVKTCLVNASVELPPEIVQTILDRSAGNFLYAKLVTDGVLKGRFQGGEIENLPRGLPELYFYDFASQFGDPPGRDYDDTARLLSVIRVAQQPPTEDLLKEAAKMTLTEVSDRLEPISAYLVERDGTYAFYHKCFEDWLRSPDHRYGGDEAKGHGDLADVAVTVRANLEAAVRVAAGADAHPGHDYVLRYGSYHLVKVGRFAEAIHLLDVLRSRQREWEGVTQSSFDKLTKELILGLGRRRAEEAEARRINPVELACLLRDFYEIDPLAPVLRLLVHYRRDDWPEVLETLLGAGNYVLRYALSEALADELMVRPPAVTLAELTDLLALDKSLSERELGGYALKVVYIRNPAEIDPRHLETLAESTTYPGRSILGDLLLNLIFQGPQGRYRRDLVTSRRFWEPIWDFNWLDIWTLQAAEAFVAKEDLPSAAAPEVRDAFNALRTADEWCKAELDGRNGCNPKLRPLLEDYFKLGLYVEQFRQTRDALARAPEPDLKRLMRLFFAHPLWSVAEAAATVLPLIIGDDPRRTAIIADLFDDPPWREDTDPHWRARYGAIEAAFAVRHLDQGKIFFAAVGRFYRHPNCRVRALCAEDLVSIILNHAGAMSKKLLEDFAPEIGCWLRDEDCWVLEHMYRLCTARDVSRLLAQGVSRLLKDKPNWFQLEREAFLIYIEDRKRELIAA